ncbi:hypothetical protein AC1031_018848 [Aphanomyces cochlioides]|nr:hypothetical protein AC1031_018848 [Aphanomyces cochlioides]
MYSFRAARREDADDIARVHSLGWEQAFAEILPADFIDSVNSRRQEQYSKLLESPNPSDQSALVVAVHRDTASNVMESIAGCCTIRKNQSKCDTVQHAFGFELACVYVLAAHHGTGASKKLLRAGMELMAMQPSDTMFCKVFEKNSRAVRFYEKMGATPVGREVTTEYSVEPEAILIMGWSSVQCILGS